MARRPQAREQVLRRRGIVSAARLTSHENAKNTGLVRRNWNRIFAGTCWRSRVRKWCGFNALATESQRGSRSRRTNRVRIRTSWHRLQWVLVCHAAPMLALTAAPANIS